MSIPFARIQTESASGSTIKAAQCESCGLDYFYDIERTAVGSGVGLLFLDNAGTQQRAQAEADEKLKKQLDTEIEVVPCPSCGWVHSDMDSLARRRFHRGMKWAGFASFSL